MIPRCATHSGDDFRGVQHTAEIISAVCNIPRRSSLLCATHHEDDLRGVHEIFYPYLFAWFEPIWAPDKQTEVFPNLALILSRYSITKCSPRCASHRRDHLGGVHHTVESKVTNFEKISAVCCTPQRSKMFLHNQHFLASYIFFHYRCVHVTLKGFHLIVSLKATRDRRRFRFCFRGVQFISTVCCTPWRSSRQYVAHCWYRLCGSVSRDVRPLFFSWFEPIWAPS